MRRARINRVVDVVDMGITRKEIDEGKNFVDTKDVRDYLQYPEKQKEREIEMAIAVAISHFENTRNVSLRAMTLELTTQASNGVVRLYHPKIAEILSVKGALTGRDIEYSYTGGERLVLQHWSSNIGGHKRKYEPVTVLYKTDACDDYIRYKNAVIAWAGLVFDGSTDKEAYNRVERWV